MGQLAVFLAEAGYEVTGSDKAFYEPMGSFLEASKVILKKGYDATNVPADVNLVVIGNAISYGHPEVEVVEKNDLPYTCFPRILFESIIKGKTSIVATGTHGKSTTSAMCTYLLNKLGRDPSYFVGGVIPGTTTSLHRGGGQEAVMEGDEYDDVFFSKKPKFLHYEPKIAIINAIEYDHADLYGSLEEIEKAFWMMVESLPDDATLIACTDFEAVQKLVERARKETKVKIITFGTKSPEVDYYVSDFNQVGFNLEFSIKTPTGETIKTRGPMVGDYNAKTVSYTHLTLPTICSV